MKKIALTTILSASAIIASSANVAFAEQHSSQNKCSPYVILSGGYGGFNAFGFEYGSSHASSTGQEWTNYKEGILKYPKGGKVSLGVGYNFSDNIRSDLSAEYKPSYKADYDNIIADVLSGNKGEFKQKAYNLKANVYYDFHNDSSITPFFLVGLGWERAKSSLTLPSNSPMSMTTNVKDDFSGPADGVSLVKSISSKYKNNFAFNVGAGLSYKVTEAVKLDLTYKVANATHNKFGNLYLQADSDPTVNNIYRDMKQSKSGPAYEHSINFGVRFYF